MKINLNLTINNGQELDEAIEKFTPKGSGIHNSTTTNNYISSEIRYLILYKRRIRRIWQLARNPIDKRKFYRVCTEL